MKENLLVPQFQEQLQLLAGVSADPGVYLMKDASGKVIYVGKARNLKKRLNSYFNRPEHPDPKTAVLVKRIASIETLITATENEALILESTLIKKHRPRYNVILKDDKRYPSLRMDIASSYPNLTVVRKINRDGALYFGPYTSPSAVYQIIKIINKTFKLRKCKDRMFKVRKRPCLNYQIGSCLGPCCHKVDPDRYQEMVWEVVLFLRGRTPDLVTKLKRDMNIAALERQYELAAEIRDKLFAIEKTLEKQIVVMTDFLDRDVIGFARSSADSIVTILFVRAGYLVGSRNFHFSETLASNAELIGSFIHQFYEQTILIPDEILVSTVFDEMDVIHEWLTDLKKIKVDLILPQRGPKAHLIQMAEQNAGNELKNLIEDRLNDQTMLQQLQKQLGLARLPVRIECFDNSNISGTQPVSGMVVFEQTRPKKSDYRKYRIKTVSEPNDYATMAEVLNRRYGKNGDSALLPDLLMVDGGKGQLGIAVSVLDGLNLSGRFDVIGIAKKDDMKGETQDKIYKPGRLNPVNLDRDGNLLLFLQRIRDEAHRFVITYHRSRRRAVAIRSVLDTIAGVGPKRKQALLKHYGSIKAIRAASLDELSQVPGMNKKIAEMIQSRLSIPLTEDE